MRTQTAAVATKGGPPKADSRRWRKASPAEGGGGGGAKMGRKKIQISRITDERNRQVRKRESRPMYLSPPYV